MPLPDEAIDALVADVPVDAADVMALAGALSLGEPEAEVQRLELEARERVWTDDARTAVAEQIAARRSDPLASGEALEAATAELAEGDRFPHRLVRVAALRLLTTDPAMREHFGSLEDYLQRAEDDEEIARLSIPLAGEAALPAASIDLERALHEAGLYIDSFPKPGLAVEGDLAERASLWLAERLKMTEDEEAARPRMQRAVAAFAEAAQQEFPLSSQGLRAVASRDDELWQALADRIVARRIVNIGW